MEQVKLMTEKDFNQLISKIDQLEAKVDTLVNEGVGSKQIFTISDACEYLQVCKRTLQKYRDEGMISFSQVVDKIYFQKSDIDAFLSSNRVEAFKTKGGEYVC